MGNHVESKGPETQKSKSQENASEDNSHELIKYKKTGKIKKEFYEQELAKLQGELVKLQFWVKRKGMKVIVLFEGRDAAGKGGVIKRLTEPMNPRGCRVVALDKPSDKERTQWYFQRYVTHFPSAGEIVIFDRSWYNRAGIERVMGFCTDEEYEQFLRTCPEFERMLVRSGIILLKYWFSVSDDEQEHRLRERTVNPVKRWKFSAMDLESWGKWSEYSKAKDMMFRFTDTKLCPWYVVSSDQKKTARLNCISHFLQSIYYEDVTPEEVEFPARTIVESYVRPPMDEQTFVPEKY